MDASSTEDSRLPRAADDAPVEHAGHGEVLDARQAAGRLAGRSVRSTGLPTRGSYWSRSGIRIDFHVEAPAADKRRDAQGWSLPVAGRTSPSRIVKSAVGRFSRPAASDRIARAPSRPPAGVGAAARHTGTAARPAMVRRRRRVTLDYREPFDRHSEFFRSKLPIDRADARPHIDVAGEDRHGSVDVHCQEAVEIRGRCRTGSAARRAPLRADRRFERRADREADDERASCFEEVAA
jgi:hypothetical protein